MTSERVDPMGDTEFEDANPRPDPKRSERRDEPGDMEQADEDDEPGDEG